MIDPKLKNVIIIIVTMVWAANFTAGLVVDQYEPDQTINAIFMAIVGGLFALGASKGGGGGNGGSHSASKDDRGPDA